MLYRGASDPSFMRGVKFGRKTQVFGWIFGGIVGWLLLFGVVGGFLQLFFR